MNERDNPGDARSRAGEHRRTATEAAEEGEWSGPPTERVRIAGVEAAVAAGLVGRPDPDEAEDLELDDLEAFDESFPAFDPAVARLASEDPRPAHGAPSPEPAGLARATDAMPDWSDPPTGQVPRVLLDGFGDEPASSLASGGTPAVRGPVWREREQDWNDEDDLSHLAVEGETLITADSGSPDDVDPYDFDFGPRRSRKADAGAASGAVAAAGAGERAQPAVPARVYGPEPPAPDPEVAGDNAWEQWTGPPSGAAEQTRDDVVVPRTAAERRRRPARHAARRGLRAGQPRSAAAAEVRPAAAEAATGRAISRPIGTRIVTGLAVAAVGIACFFAGSVATLVLATVVVTLAVAECFAALQRGGYRPATLLALAAAPVGVVLAYLKGPTALLVVMVVFVATAMLWYLTGVTKADPVLNIGATVAGFAWVGLLGSFAGLLLAPHAFPHRHGVAYLVGALAVAVANDVGAFAVGSRFGRHKLAPRVSPGKSWEGLAGGTVLTLLVAGLAVSQLHPWDARRALVLGVLVCVLAPLGDLVESQFKRALGIKDTGSLLPAHGGVLDRVDGFLFVLPAAWLLVRALHLG